MVLAATEAARERPKQAGSHNFQYVITRQEDLTGCQAGSGTWTAVRTMKMVFLVNRPSPVFHYNNSKQSCLLYYVVLGYAWE